MNSRLFGDGAALLRIITKTSQKTSEATAQTDEAY
jgi:hypothetical protein